MINSGRNYKRSWWGDERGHRGRSDRAREDSGSGGDGVGDGGTESSSFSTVGLESNC